jgi:hypothetical protein
LEKKSLSENERRIVSRVKSEMNRPRLTESVRNGFSAQATPVEEKPAAVLRERESLVLSALASPHSNLLNSAHASRAWLASIELL